MGNDFAGKLLLETAPALPAGLRSAGTLYVNGRALSLADFEVNGNVLQLFPSPRVPVWITGAEVLLTLQAPRPPVWSATLTVQTVQSVFLGCADVGSGSCSNTSVLTDNAFTYAGVDYHFGKIGLNDGDSVLKFTLDRTFPSGLKSAGRITIAGTTISLVDLSSDADNVLEIPLSTYGLSWSAGDTIEISLTGPPPTGVVLSTTTLTITEPGISAFTVALSADPGTDTEIRLVRSQYFQSGVGEPDHRWNANAVSLLPTSLTFTAGSMGNWSTPQQVVVSVEDDVGDQHEQLMVLVLQGSQSGDYRPVRGSGHNAVNGVHVTVTDDDGDDHAPTNVQAHAGKARQLSGLGADLDRWLARFSWQPPGGSITVTGYDFQWRREGGAWPVGATSLGVSDTSLIIRPNLGDTANDSEGTVLGYRVRTRTADGASPWIEGTLTLDNPANLVRDLLVLPGNAGELSLSWSAPAGWPATDYEVHYREPENGGWQGMSSDPENGWVDAGYNRGTDQLMTIQNLKDGTAYAVRVRAKSDWDFTWTVAQGTTSGTAPAIGGSGGTGGDLGVVRNPNAQSDYAGLIADVKLWRDDPCCAHNQAHTDRWDRVLLALGESVADASLEPMTASEAQGFADRGWTRWTGVAETLRELETAAQNDPVPPAVGPDPGDSSGDSPGSPGDAPDEGPGAGPGAGPEPANQAPTVSATPADVSGLEAGATREVSLAGVFHDADGDALTITGGPDDDQIVTVEVASDGSRLTLTGVSEGAAIVLVFAEDPSGASVFTQFNVTVVAAPEPPASLTGAATRYDADSNGKIDLSEYRRALNDYVAKEISYTELLEVVTAYQAS